MKSVRLPPRGLTLHHLMLSHMDFLNAPTAIKRSRLIMARATQDEKPNELTNPQKLLINHHRNTYSFGLIMPAIFPDTDISSCVCIILLSRTSSSSQLILYLWHACKSGMVAKHSLKMKKMQTSN